MPINFATYLMQLDEALQAQNGPNLAYLLRPTSPHGKDFMKEFRNPTRASLAYYKGNIETPWDEIAINYVLVVNHVAKNRPGEAFKEQSALVSAFFRYFLNNSGWTLPALFAILRDLRDLAFDADVHAYSNNQKSECMEDAARIMAKAFTNCMTDRMSPYAESRKWGIYYIVGLVMKSYFRVKRISLSKNILRALEANTDRPPLSAYPRAHQVTFRYYLGMLSFLNEEYAKSEEELTLAFYNCHSEARGNLERILTYLIPLRLLRGHMPSKELLRRFPTVDELFSPFLRAIRAGDISGFDSVLARSERRLFDLGLWLMLEKARELCIRGCFRRGWVAAERSNRMPIALFHTALRVAGLDVESEEAECLVANMIYKGFMKGYISHEKQMVVLSNVNAFPRVADRPAPFAL